MNEEIHESLTAPILIVEDNSFCYYALTSILQQYQLEFDTAWDGEWAFEMVERRYKESGTTYKLIVMDFYMPNLNGLMTMQKILDLLSPDVIDRKLKLPYLVLLTNGNVQKFGSKMLESGFDKVLKKPIFKQGVQRLLIDA